MGHLNYLQQESSIKYFNFTMKLLPKITSQILFFFVITGCDKTNITVQTVPVIAGTPPIPAEYMSQPKISESEVQFIKQIKHN